MNQPIQNISERFPKTEKIDGKIYLMSAPCDEHIDVQANLIHIFMDYFKRNKKKCRARQDAKTNLDEDNYLKPDLKVVCYEKNNEGTTTIVIEVLSKSTQKRDLGVKMKKYAELGIKEYWIITWELSLATIYLLNEDKKYEFYNSYAFFKPGEELDEEEQKEVLAEFSPVSFPELVIRLEDVFDIF